MARSQLQKPTDDLTSDSGAVLFSFVQGEQLEYPVYLSFLPNLIGYEYEVAVIEAANVIGQTEHPTNVASVSVSESLSVRIPTNRGVWQGIQSYNMGEVVAHNGEYFLLSYGAGYISDTLPNVDPVWTKVQKNLIYIQIPSTLGTGWILQPSSTYNTYGFIELRVSETTGTFKKTWKPVRGMVEVQYSPTHVA